MGNRSSGFNNSIHAVVTGIQATCSKSYGTYYKFSSSNRGSELFVVILVAYPLYYNSSTVVAK